MIHVYAPKSKYKKEETERLQENPGKTLEKDKYGYDLVIGDFTATIGK